MLRIKEVSFSAIFYLNLLFVNVLICYHLYLYLKLQAFLIMFISTFLLLFTFMLGIKSHLPTDLNCDFDISFDCSWFIDGDYIKATNMDGSFDSADSGVLTQFLAFIWQFLCSNHQFRFMLTTFAFYCSFFLFRTFSTFQSE